MRKNYILALFLTLVIVVATYFIADDNISNIAKVKNTVSNSGFYCMNEISEENDKYIIKAYIPCTKIKELDEKLENEVCNIVENFKKEINDLKLQDTDKKFELNLNYSTYEYDKYCSFLIFYSFDLGGAHPDRNFVTLNYNKEEKSFVTIDTLIAKDNDILDKLSKYCYNVLKEKIDQKESDDSLKEGTSTYKKNFEKFVLSQDGIIIFFPNYSLTSYYLGEFEVVVPYNELSI